MAQISLTFPDGNARNTTQVSLPRGCRRHLQILGKKAISRTVDGAHWDLHGRSTQMQTSRSTP